MKHTARAKLVLAPLPHKVQLQQSAGFYQQQLFGTDAQRIFPYSGNNDLGASELMASLMQEKLRRFGAGASRCSVDARGSCSCSTSHAAERALQSAETLLTRRLRGNLKLLALRATSPTGEDAWLHN